METRSSPSMTELRAVAADRGLKHFQHLSKPELFDLLQRRQGGGSSKVPLRDASTGKHVDVRPCEIAATEKKAAAKATRCSERLCARKRKAEEYDHDTVDRKRAKNVINVVDPIMLTELGHHTFEFVRRNGSIVVYNVDTLVQYILATGDFSEPETRIPFSDDDLRRIDVEARRAKLDERSVLEAKYNKHVFDEQKVKRDGLLGEYITKMLGVVEDDDAEEGEIELITCLFPSFSSIFEQIRAADKDTAAPELRQPTPSEDRVTVPRSTRSPPSFRSNSLSIDVNVPESSAAPAVLASPLTIFAAKRLPTNSHRAHPVATLASDRKSRPHAALSSSLLQYGMVISLVSDDRNGIIAAEGFASCDVRLERLAPSGDSGADAAPPKLGLGGRDERLRFERGELRLTQCSFRDCLFEVVPKMMYDATLSLQAQDCGADRSVAGAAGATLTDLQFKSDAELRLNAMTYRRLKGTNVMYGHVIQLRHVNSGRFLSADATMIPLRGAEYSQVCLEHGSPRCHFTLLPRFKLRSKGAPVQITDQLLLVAGDCVQPVSLYASTRLAPDGVSFQIVGSAAHSSQWRAIVYDSHEAPSPRSLQSRGESRGLRAGACVRLLHLESNSWLHLDPSVAAMDQSPLLLKYEAECDDAAEPSSSRLSSDSLWEIEKAAVFEGGGIKWSEAVLLRHLVTGKYLAVASEPASPRHTRSPPAMRSAPATVGAVCAQSKPHTFALLPTAVLDDDGLIPSDAVVLLQHLPSHTFLHSPDTHATTMTHIRVSSKSAQTASHAGALFSVIALPGARDEDALKIVSATPAEVNDTLLLLAYKRALMAFLAVFPRDPQAARGSPDWPQGEKEETRVALEKVEQAVADLVSFCQQSASRSPSRRRARQDMIRAHGLLALLVDMMKAPFDRYGGPLRVEQVASDPRPSPSQRVKGVVKSESLPAALQQHLMTTEPPRRSVSQRSHRSSTVRSGRSTSQTEETRMSVLACVRRIVRATSSLLVEAFQSNRDSELYMVKVAMPVLMELLGNGFQTSKPLSYLLRGDRDLVDSITSYASIIHHFFELIRSRGRSIRYMQFLVALCSSRGRGVPKTQEAICELLFNPAHGFSDAVVVPMRASASTSASASAPGLDVLVPESASCESAWTPLASFYRDFYLHRQHREAAPYCYGLLQLYVALCTDRNYLSIEQVHGMFPRKRLLACVLDATLAFSLRAVLLDLLRVAFIDCEPQKAQTCPNLTRIWTSVGDATSTAPPTAQSPEDLQFFASIKAFCMEYLERLHGKIVADDTPENQLTLSVLRVCSKLVSFGLFTSELELSRLVVAIVDILDERTDVVPRRHAPGAETALPEPTQDLLLRQQPHPSSGNSGTRWLGTTLLSESPRRATGDDDAHDYDTPPLIFRFRETAHLDGAFSSAAGDSVDPVTGVSRQYAVGSPLWLESCNARSGSKERIDALGPAPGTNSHRQPMTRAAHDADRHRVTQQNRVAMQIKDESCGILQLVDDLRLDFQISVFLSAFRAAYGDPEVGAKPRFEDFCRRVFGRVTGEDLVDAGGGHDSPLSRFLFDNRSLQCSLSLSTLAKRPVITVLLQLLMYEHPSLVSRALELLLHQFNQHDQLLKAMQSVQLLVSSETIMLYQRLKGDVDHLRRLAETTEVWMDLTSKTDFDKADSACALLRAVRQVLEMQAPSGTQRAGSQAAMLVLDTALDSPPPPQRGLPNRKLLARRHEYSLDCSLGLVSRESASLDLLHMAAYFAPTTLRNVRSTSGVSLAAEARRLLRNLKAPQHVTAMMIDGAHFFEAHTMAATTGAEPDDDKRKQRRAIRLVFEESLRFLCTFCTGDAENQALLAPHAAMLVEYIAELDVAQQALVAIYAHNEALYKAVPSDVVAAVVARLLQDPLNPRFLYLLETLVVCDERPVVENQLLVLFQIARSLENGKLLQFFDSPETTVPQFATLFERFERLQLGEANSVALEPFSDAVARDSRVLEYHVRLLHVLAACATGKSSRCQEICQQILPLGVACDVLTLTHCPDGVQFALLRFVRHAYLLAEDAEAPPSDVLLQLLWALGDTLVAAVVSYIREHHDDDVNRTARWRLDKKKKGKSVPLLLSLAKAPSESRSLYLVLWAIVPTLVALFRNFGHVAEPDGELVVRLVLALSSLLVVAMPSDWALPDATTDELEELLALLDTAAEKHTSPLLPTASLAALYDDALDREARANLEAANVDGDVFQLWESLRALEQARSPTAVLNEQLTGEPARPRPPLDRRGSISMKSLKPGLAMDPATTTAPSDRSPAKARPEQTSAVSQARSDRASSAVSTHVAPSNSTNGPPRKPASAWLKAWWRPREPPIVRNPYSRQSTMYLHATTALGGHASLEMAPTAAEDALVSRPRQQRFEAFDAFLRRVASHPHTALAMREELNRMVDGILEVERTLQHEFDASRHGSNVQLTFNDVVAKLVAHVEAFEDAGYGKTNATLLDVFCRMIAADQDWERRHAMQLQLNRLGVTRLVVQLLATRDDDAVAARCIELGVALLDGMNAEVQETFYRCWTPSVGDAFCRRLQAQIEAASSRLRTGQLDTQRRAASDERTAWRRRSVLPKDPPALDDDATTAAAAATRDTANRPTTLLFRFLQLLCEGHYLQAQRFLIRQPLAREPVNLVEATTSFLLEASLALADVDLGLMIQLFETITEFCQGPCTEAQETVTNFKFLSTVNALLMSSFERSDRAFQVQRLRAAVVVTLLSLLEGRSDRAIHLQLVQELNFAALHRNLVDAYRHFGCQYDGAYEGNVRCSDDFYLEMGFNLYILLQQLADCFPASASWIPVARRATRTPPDVTAPQDDAAANDAELLQAFQFFQAHSARVEIVWDHQRDHPGRVDSDDGRQDSSSRKSSNGGSGSGSGSSSSSASAGALIAYYFPLHPICFCLTEQSKKKLVWGVSRGANKLPDFYERSDKLVDEMAHQSRLRRRPVLSALARRSDLFKRLSFALGVAINVIVLLFYQADGIHATPYAASSVTVVYPSTGMSHQTSLAIDVGLTIAGSLQLGLCCVILVCYLINSAPLLIKKGWKRRIQAQRARLSKTMASTHRRGTHWDDRESFQDTEQLLRSLREREEEYDYLFLPRRHTATKLPKLSASKVVHADDTLSRGRYEQATSARASSAQQHPARASAWKRVWRFLFGPASVVIGGRDRELVAPDPERITRLEYVRTVAISLYFLACSARVLYYLAQIAVAILGAYVNHFFFAFHLLDIVNRYQDLSNVLRSVVRPAKVLGLTIVLYLVVVYVFAIIGFFFFREDFTPGGLTAAQREGRAPYQCQRLLQCFLVSLDQGFKSDGGLGGYLRQRQLGESTDSYLRLAFDQLYNFILIIMLLNIVFGVIIDTFASLRTADNDKLLDMQSRCFICSIDAYTFDRKTKRGFHDHIYMEHNMWHYLYLFVHIRKKPITEYNGLELYLAKLMAKKDMTFFPNHRARCLEAPVESDVAVVNHVQAMQLGHRAGLAHAGGAEPSLQLDAAVDAPRSPASGPRGVLSPRHRGADRETAIKLERMHGTIDAILAAQTEIKQEQRRLAERQAQLIESLVASSSHGNAESGQSHDVSRAPTPSSLAVPRVGRGIAMTPSSRQRSPTTAPPDLISPRVVSGVPSTPPPPSLSLPPRSISSSSRTRSQPQVFNFDAVVGDDP
ncbi:hypothetical protein P43SY_003040 [Pythium insidiosum]|uniref:MIR domain-containing protein n=1 Tax=Pythium insidiosum TaxID=114742 RepID=A0AAD5M469_PYTIN|nr:hypothetical protein P43SY_003040 [Pythium insidiosum]